MSLIEKHRKHVEYTRKRNYIGYYEYKVRPVTERGKQIFAEIIEDKVEHKVEYKKTPFLNKLFRFNKEEINLLSTEENYKAAGFNGELEVAYFEVEPEGEMFAKERLIRNTVASTPRITRYDFDVTLGKFVPYDPVKELDYDDIPDLRA